jgi:hypothetical protein
MASTPLFYQLLLITLVLICLLVHVGLQDGPPQVSKTPLEPKTRRRWRTKEPKPFAGLIQQPLCEACEQGIDTRPRGPGRHRPSSPLHEDASVPSIHKVIFVPIRTVRIMAGWDLVICGPMATPVASPGDSSNVSRATAISMKRPAPFFMANTLQLT